MKNNYISITAVAATPTTTTTEPIKTEPSQQQQQIKTETQQETQLKQTTDAELCGLISEAVADHHQPSAGLNHNNNHLDLPVGVSKADLDLKVIKTETQQQLSSNSMAFDGLSELLMANGSTGDLNLDALDPIDTWESGSSSSGGSVGSHFEFACTQDEVSDMLSDIGVSETDWVDNLIAI